jgi:hypothetical protein
MSTYQRHERKSKEVALKKIITMLKEEKQEEQIEYIVKIAQYNKEKQEAQQKLKEEKIEQKKRILSRFIDINYSEIINERLKDSPKLVIDYKGNNKKYVEKMVQQWYYKVYVYNSIKENKNVEHINIMKEKLEYRGFINYEHFLYECAHRMTLAPIVESRKINGWDCYHTSMLYEWDNQRIVFYTCEADDEYSHEIDYNRDNFNELLSSYCEHEYYPKYNDDDSLNRKYKNRYNDKNISEKDVLKIISYQPHPNPPENYIKEHPKYSGKINIAYFIFLLYNY